MARGSSWPAPSGGEGGEVDALIYPPWLRCGYAVADPLGRAGGQAALFPCIVYGRAAVRNCRTCGCARSSWRGRRSRRRLRGHSLACHALPRAGNDCAIHHVLQMHPDGDYRILPTCGYRPMRISNHIRYVRARDEKGKGRRWRARGDVG